MNSTIRFRKCAGCDRLSAVRSSVCDHVFRNLVSLIVASGSCPRANFCLSNLIFRISAFTQCMARATMARCASRSACSAFRLKSCGCLRLRRHFRRPPLRLPLRRLLQSRSPISMWARRWVTIPMWRTASSTHCTRPARPIRKMSPPTPRGLNFLFRFLAELTKSTSRSLPIAMQRFLRTLLIRLSFVFDIVEKLCVPSPVYI